MDPAALFLTVFRASLLAVGGQAALPLLRDDLVRTGITTDERIIEAITVGRLSTGPSGLYIVALGFFIGGWPGAAIALAAAVLPPMLIVPAAALIRPRLLAPRVSGLVRGVALTTTGLVVATTLELLGSAARTTPGPGPTLADVPLWQIGLAGIGLIVGWDGRRHPLWVIVVGAAAGLVLLA